MTIRPMKASAVDFDKLRFPIIGMPKLDGFRCLAMEGKPRTNSMKLHENRFVQSCFAAAGDIIEGLDGELIVGSPHNAFDGDNVFDRTSGPVRRHEGQPDFTFWVFDYWNRKDQSYENALIELECADRAEYFPKWVKIVPHEILNNLEEVLDYEEKMLKIGYEGIMLRCPNGPYKQGRSSVREGWALKVKRWADNEAEVTGFYEKMHNSNEATRDILGGIRRSGAQAGMVGLNTLGAIEGKILNGKFKGQMVYCTGLTHDVAQEIWNNHDSYLGKFFTFKWFEPGSKDSPRHPGFKAWRNRDEFDLD